MKKKKILVNNQENQILKILKKMVIEIKALVVACFHVVVQDKV